MANKTGRFPIIEQFLADGMQYYRQSGYGGARLSRRLMGLPGNEIYSDAIRERRRFAC
jgi:hypothetical protein